MMSPHRTVCFYAPLVAAAALLGSFQTGPALAQNDTGWKASGGNAARYNGGDEQKKGPFAPGGSAPAAPAAQPGGEITPVPGGNLAPVDAGITRARVTKGSGALPQDQGQVWREYDIRPYTLRVTTTARPEQAIVDWILRETGYEAWHSDPRGLLSANRETLRVYHTPEMQAIVADIVDRFVSSASGSYGFTLRVSTVVSPNWRAKA